MGRSLRTLDLNLVPVLRALLEECSVTRAADRIGLSQPAASNALSRLRTQFADPLLVKSGRSMIRTPLADRLLPLLEIACEDLEQALFAQTWSPRTARRRFRLVMSDFLMLRIIGALRTTLDRDAPNVTVRFGPVGLRLREELRQGRVDVACLTFSDHLADVMEVQRLHRSRLVAVVGPEHAFAQRPPRSEAEFLAAPRIGLRVPSHGLSGEQRPMANLLASANLPLECGTVQLTSLPALALAAGCLAVVPSMVAEGVVPALGMHTIEIPGDPRYYDLCAFWHPRFRMDPGHRWFRDLVTGLIHDAQGAR